MDFGWFTSNLARNANGSEVAMVPSYRAVKIKEETTMDVFALLKADHELVAELMQKIDESTERAVKGRTETFTRLKSELDLHAMIEEEIVYPVLEDADETRDITLEAYEEHRLVKQLLTELESEPNDTEEWTAKFTVLKENVEHHVEEEEGEMFKNARQALDKEQIDSLTKQVEQAKRKNKAAAG